MSVPDAIPDDDLSLIRRVAARDVDAFEQLYRRYSKPALNFFYRLSWDRTHSEDWLQELFVKIWTHAGQFQGQSKFTSWMFQIAKNIWINAERRDDRRPREVAIESQPESVEIRRGTRPESRLQHVELEAAIAAAMLELPEKLRLAFTLAHYEAMRYQDIADALEIPVGTVKSRVSLAETQLRKRLKQFRNEADGP